MPSDFKKFLRLPILLAALAALAPASPVLAQRNLKDVPKPDIEAELKAFKVAPDFQINLYASDPMIAKPLQMNFDPQGRLWVVSSEVYPQIKPGQVANDKVIVLQDTDGDGKADKHTVFADGLLIPTGVEPGDGGVYVVNSTEVLHLSDTNGDGKADHRRIVLSGFGTEDTHHLLHTLRWGHDGMLYMNQSIYIHSHVETPHGVRRLDAGGIWHFRPETMQLEVFSRGFVNTWGHHMDRWGQSFATDGAYGEGINYVFPGSVFFTAHNAKRIVKGLNPGQPKHCGLEVVSGRHLPDDWQGNMIANDFRAHRVNRFVVTESGSGYASRKMDDVVSSTHTAFRPVDVKMGPDGAIYIADWYNPIIQHGEVDFRDPRRDQVHGRIWRISHKTRPLVKPPALATASTRQLLESLAAPEQWTRQQAKRVLKEKGPAAVLPELSKWIAEISPTDEASTHLLLEGFWVYQSLDVVEPKLLERMLTLKDHRVRAAAVRAVYHWHTRLENAHALLERAVADEHPRVRLEAVRALSQLGTARAAQTAMAALDKPMDEFLDFALWQTARDLQPLWLAELQAGKLNFGNNIRHLSFALAATGSTQVVGTLVNLLDKGGMDAEQQANLSLLICSLGGPKEMGDILTRNLRTNDVGLKTRTLAAARKASEERGVKPAVDAALIIALIESSDVALSSEASLASGTWKLEPARASLEKLAAASGAPLESRRAAMMGLSRLPGPATGAFLGKLAVDPAQGPARTHAAIALANTDLKASASASAAILASAGKNEDVSALYAPFVSRKGGPDALAKALEPLKLDETIAQAGLRDLQTSGQESSALAAALRKAGGLKTVPFTVTPEELQRLVDLVKTTGDAARGESVYRRKELLCATCHAIAGAGGRVGPDMVSIGASAQVDYLVESMIDPNKKVKEGYHLVIVNGKDGRVLAGTSARKTDTQLMLIDAGDNEVSMPLSNVQSEKIGQSLMPPGLTAALSQAEFADLVRFLSELGRTPAFTLGKEQFVRRWEVKTEAPAPQVVYSKVAGELPEADLPAIGGKRVAAFRVNLKGDGEIGFKFNATAGVTIETSGRKITPDSGQVARLSMTPGTHTFTVTIDAAKWSGPLKIELLDFGAARAQIVNTK